MDFASIGLSAILSALLFVVLEFTVILPLFRKIVATQVNKTVNESLVPSITSFVDSKVNDLTEILTKSLFNKFKGFFGGRAKGVNSLIRRLESGEDFEDIEDDYEPSTIEKVYDILETVRPFLPNPSTQKTEDPMDSGIREVR